MPSYDQYIDTVEFNAATGVISATTVDNTVTTKTIRSQSDWTETDPDHRAYINAKPIVQSVATLVARNALSGSPSGSIITVTGLGISYVRDAVASAWIRIDSAPDKCDVGIPHHIIGNTYGVGELVHINDVWYHALVLTTNTPPHADWEVVTIDDFFC